VTPAEAKQGAAPPAADEAALLARLRAGDEDAFGGLVDSCHPTMLALALAHTGSRTVAEEVVQEAWVGVIRGLDGFEGRSTLKTWIMRIVINTAMARGGREARSVPFSSLARGADEPAVEPERFRSDEDAFPGHWRGYPGDWGALPEQVLLRRETLAVAMTAIDELPPAQRTVITLRDVYGCRADEVCDTLDLDPAYQRVLLHRARSHVRAALERHLHD
jgi:RNA polymerase sigma-70 factor (ECF subfamily)